MFKKTVLLMFLGVLAPAVANAGLLTFDFTGGTSSLSGPRGNERTFTSGSLSVDATAWSFHDDGTSGWSAYLGHYNPGLGVTNCDNQNSSSTCTTSGDTHYVDNGGSDNDYIKFIFSEAVTPISVELVRRGGNSDADISYLVGAFSNNYNDWTHVQSPGSGNPFSIVFPSTSLSDTLRLGAKFTGSNNDDFKVRSLTVRTVQNVPEPAPLALMALGLLGLGLSRRKLKLS